MDTYEMLTGETVPDRLRRLHDQLLQLESDPRASRMMLNDAHRALGLANFAAIGMIPYCETERHIADTQRYIAAAARPTLEANFRQTFGHDMHEKRIYCAACRQPFVTSMDAPNADPCPSCVIA